MYRTIKQHSDLPDFSGFNSCTVLTYIPKVTEAGIFKFLMFDLILWLLDIWPIIFQIKTGILDIINRKIIIPLTERTTFDPIKVHRLFLWINVAPISL